MLQYETDLKDKSVSFHVTSFIQTKDDKIIAMDEYYADDGTAPQWRLDKHIGTSIEQIGIDRAGSEGCFLSERQEDGT